MLLFLKVSWLGSGTLYRPRRRSQEQRPTVRSKPHMHGEPRAPGEERTGPAQPRGRMRRTWACSPSLGALGQWYLPENHACSDYTKCQGCLWASEPFCSVKYESESGGTARGEGGRAGTLTSLPRLNSLNQEPGVSFTQLVSLAWDTTARGERV